MSLRAKIEAVIYAAEEPVTMTQLVALFAAEAIESRAQRQAAGADDPASSGELFPPERTAEAAAAEHAHAPVSDHAIAQAVEHPEQVSATQPDGFAESAEDPAQPATHGGQEADESRRLARARERDARDEVRRALEALIAEYDASDRGVEIREIAGGYRVATRPEYHDAVRGFVKSLKPPMKLSLQALETLAVIAYRQPVTAPEVSEIRGVDSGGVLGSLISRKLVTTAGRKQVVGRPILYRTTKEFLLRFGLKDLGELPSIEEFEKMAGELAEPAAQLDLHNSQPHQFQPDPGAASMQSEQRDETAGAEPSTAAEVQAAPELAEEREEEELAASARANVQVDDESSLVHDLPGVTRDTAGHVNIDSVRSRHVLGSDDEDFDG